MNKIETGGPAFPCKAYSGLMSERMSIRDYFAAKALQGAMTRDCFADGFYFTEKAAWVYMMADAMMEARKS